MLITVVIYNFNATLKYLTKKESKSILDDLCGKVLGCEYAIKESKRYGSTSLGLGLAILKKTVKVPKDIIGVKSEPDVLS